MEQGYFRGGTSSSLGDLPIEGMLIMSLRAPFQACCMIHERERS